MSRPEQRSDKAHLTAVSLRSAQSHLRSLRSWLGKQAAIGGRPYVERIVKSDEFAERFMNGLDGDTRMQALASVAAILANAPVKPAKRPPSPKERVKLRWDDDLKARFKRLAPRILNNAELAAALGLPPCCEGSVRRARHRYLGRVRATVERPSAMVAAIVPAALAA